MSNQDDAAAMRTFSIILVSLCIVAFIVYKILTMGGSAEDSGGATDSVASRIAPMGQVNTGSEALMLDPPAVGVAAGAADAGHAAPAASSEAAPSTAAADVGKAVYDKSCFVCHAAGIAGAPKFADMGAWEARLARGRDANIANAINGYSGDAGIMPAKGGNPALSDADVAAAVDYMLAAVGGGNGAQSAPAGTEDAAPAEPAADEAAPAASDEEAATTTTEDAEPAAEQDETATVADSAVADARGKEVYDAACFVCHTPGVAGAPKLGDAENWGPRLEKGNDALYDNAINGYMGSSGMMPPKGGRPDFSDDDVKAAVDYMVMNSK